MRIATSAFSLTSGLPWHATPSADSAIMTKSLAPSPIATVCLAEICHFSARAFTVRALTSALTISPSTFPVSCSFFTASVLEMAKSSPSLAFRWSAKKVNPPEAIANFQLCCFKWVSKAWMPGMIGMLSRIWLRWLTGTPSKHATLCIKLSLNAISPRIALAVTSATCSPTPANLAISSIHSIAMTVLSMSMTSSPGLDNEGREPCKPTSTLYALDTSPSSGLICSSSVFCKAPLISITSSPICLCKWWKAALEGVNTSLSLIKTLCSR